MQKNQPEIKQIELEDGWRDIVQKARQGFGWSLHHAAEAAGLSFETLEHWESGGGAPPPLDQLASLARVLRLDPIKLARIQAGEWRPTPTRSGPPESSIQTRVLTGHMGTYPVHGYLLSREGSPDAILVDTAYEPKHALDAVLQGRLMLRWIVLTHCHRDHMEGASFLKAQTGARVAVPREECPVYRAHHRESPDLAVMPDDTIDVGPGLSLHALSTPGHTAGGTSYFVNGVCCVGDALFAGSTGRSMSPQGYTALLHSLRERVLSLAPDTILCPGHGPLTTVGEELKHNPFFPTP